MRRIFSLILLVSFVSGINGQTITIREALANPWGQKLQYQGSLPVMLLGIQVSGISRMQQQALLFSVLTLPALLQKGTILQSRGILKEYQGIVELDPVSDFTVHSSGNKLPDTLLITPSQQHDSIMGMLVQVQGVVFEKAGQNFSAATYDYTASGETGTIYVHAYNPLNGKQIPSFPAKMTGIASTFFNNPQILVRDMNDFEAGGSIWLTSPVSVDSITSEGFVLSWTTNIDGSTQLAYGNTDDLEFPAITSPGTTTEHTIKVSGRNAAEFIYAKAFSVIGEDTAWSVLNVNITQSNSSGVMKVYFNRTVDNSVSSGTDAVQLFHAIDDTLVQYINRARHTIDFTIYNYNTTEIADITGALNAAHGRGVEVRIVNDDNLSDNAGWETLNPTIGQITSPPSDYYAGIGIMHNKFIVFDAESPDPEDAIVWTGSTNFTTGQVNSDPNNVIIIHDQSLAKTYRLEFEEMFGSSDFSRIQSMQNSDPIKKIILPMNL